MREYRKEHYRRNKEVYKGRAVQRKAEMRSWVDEQKSGPCSDCGEVYPPCVMDFDHPEGSDKVDKISTLVIMGNWQKLKDEVAKCELVCSNCHRLRTHTRLQPT